MKAWSQDELVAAVEAYLALLKSLEQGHPINKNACYRQLAERFPQRSIKAFEYRMQNISYVMQQLGRPWLQGLKPAQNVGAKIEQQLEQIIAQCEVPLQPPIHVAEIPAAYKAPPAGAKMPAKQTVSIVQYVRDQQLREWILQNAQGQCECCKMPAPFVTDKNEPYLEVHHLRQLAHGGSDTPANCVALCPNCHRALHHSGQSEQLRQQLYQQITRLRPE